MKTLELRQRANSVRSLAARSETMHSQPHQLNPLNLLAILRVLPGLLVLGSLVGDSGVVGTLHAQSPGPAFEQRELEPSEKLFLSLSNNTDAWGRTQRTLVLLHKSEVSGWQALGTESPEELFAHWRPIGWAMLNIEDESLSDVQREKLRLAIDLTVARFVRDFEELQREFQSKIARGGAPDRLVATPLFSELQKSCQDGLFGSECVAAKVYRHVMVQELQ